MDFIITFFRDILDGPVYIIVSIICGILICSCIGYLAERSLKKKQEKEKYVQVDNTANAQNPQNNTNIGVTTTQQQAVPNPVNQAVPDIPASIPTPTNGVANQVQQPVYPNTTQTVEVNPPVNDQV